MQVVWKKLVSFFLFIECQRNSIFLSKKKNLFHLNNECANTQIQNAKGLLILRLISLQRAKFYTSDLIEEAYPKLDDS